MSLFRFTQKGLCFFILFLFLFAASGCIQGVEKKQENLLPLQASQYLAEKKDVVVIDVRTAQEVATGSISGAIFMDFYAPDFKNRLNTLDKNTPYLLICRTGRRSGITLEMMKTLQFRDVRHVTGGLVEWKKQGLPMSIP